jgi:hypothetical protein
MRSLLIKFQIVTLLIGMTFFSISRASEKAGGIDVSQVENLVETAFSRAKSEATKDIKYSNLELQLKKILAAQGVQAYRLNGPLEKWSNLDQDSNETQILKSNHSGHYNVMAVSAVFNVYSGGSNYYSKFGARIEMNFRAIIAENNQDDVQIAIESFKVLSLIGVQ